MQNIKHYYCGVSNVNYWIISVFKKTEKAIERQVSYIKKSIFIFYRRSSVNHMWGRNKEKVWD